MRIDTNATKFDPQVMALAMPTDSHFTKGAEGITNLGKVFLDADARAEASKLNALKMEEANQSIIGKQNENSVFGEKQERERTTWVQDIRNKKLDGIKKDLDNQADIKKQTDNGYMESFGKLVPLQTFVDPKTGMFSEDLYKQKRAEFVQGGGWASDNVHLFDAKVDEYRKKSLETDKTKAEIGYKGAQTKKEIEETAWIAPKAKAYVATQASVVTKNNAGANLDNVNASLAPQKVAIAQTKEQRLGGSVDGKTIKDLTPKERLRYATDPAAMEQLFPNYEKLGPKNKAVVNQKFIQGIYADGISEDPNGSADNNWRPTYQKKDLPPLPKVLPSTRPSSQTPSSTYGEGTVIKNAQGVHMVMKNGAWVKQ